MNFKYGASELGRNFKSGREFKNELDGVFWTGTTMSEQTFTPLPVPDTPADSSELKLPFEDLSDGQQSKLQEVLDHFSAATYAVPGVEEKGELMEEEKMWLVSRHL